MSSAEMFVAPDAWGRDRGGADGKESAFDAPIVKGRGYGDGQRKRWRLSAMWKPWDCLGL